MAQFANDPIDANRPIENHKDASKPILVTAAVIRHHDRFLIAQRKTDSSIEAGKWEFPGGKVEFCEHPEDCLKREILEELNLDIYVDEFLELSSHIYTRENQQPLHIVLLAYLCSLNAGSEAPDKLQLLQVQDARWITSDEFEKYDFAAADVPILTTLLDRV